MSDQPKRLSNRAVAILVGGILLLLVAFTAVCAPPPLHAVHTPNAVDVNATNYQPVARGPQLGNTTSVSTSLAALGVAVFFPEVRDAPAHLYILWTACGIGRSASWGPTFEGYNIEFIPAARQLLIHCYGGRTYWVSKPTFEGIAPIGPPVQLLVIETRSFGAGSISVAEEDHLERWFGDESEGVTVVGTATIT